MKRLVSMVVALTMMTPSIAFAEPAVQALSLNNAAVQPLRASAQNNKKIMHISDSSFGLPLLIGLIVAGGICAVACGGGKTAPSSM
jgi:hypothetical protein